MSKSEANTFGSNSRDSHRKTAQEEPYTVLQTRNGDAIGILRLPSLPANNDIPSKDMIDRITKLVKRKHRTVKLLIALSDWGWIGEREYLASSPEVVPDILLGSGIGSGIDGRIQSENRCFWVRPYSKGRTISEIDIFQWPSRDTGATWSKKDDIRSLSIGLGDKYLDHPDVSAILH